MRLVKNLCHRGFTDSWRHLSSKVGRHKGVSHNEVGFFLSVFKILESILILENVFDKNILVQLCSAGLFFLYWISNFVVPNLLTKYFQLDKVNEDQEQKPGDKRS